MIDSFDFTQYIDEANIAAEPETVLEINRELNLARHLVENTGANVFLTGKAGTGKTTFLRQLRLSSSKRMIVTAPTGVAAINAEGVTLHSFFQLSFGPYIPGQGFLQKENRKYKFAKSKRRILASIDLLVIDEISMVRPDTLDAIDELMRRYRNNDRPFGGVQLLLIGDLRQLSPVVKIEEWEILKQHYNTPYFFESHALKQAGLETVELKRIYRQQDREFVDILNAVRDGKATRDVLMRLDSRYDPEFNPDDSLGYIRLTTHNFIANRINQDNMDRLPTKSFVFRAKVKGNFPASSFPADENLELKVGAQVMFIKNDQGSERRYYNGMLGRVIFLSDDKVTVAPLDGGEPIDASPAEWENTTYTIDADGKMQSVVDGTFTQLPLRAAWSITIHKSQGLTFEHAIIDAGHSFAPGQTYVALSRCRSLDGLVLNTRITPGAIIIDKTVNAFINHCEACRPDADRLDDLQAYYQRSIIQELFDFTPLRRIFADYERMLKEYVLPDYPQYAEPLNDVATRLTTRIEAVGTKFNTLYAGANFNPEVFTTSQMNERLANGCRYFYDELMAVHKILHGFRVKIGNKRNAARVNKTAENMSFALNVKMDILQAMSQETFSVESYLKARAKATSQNS